MFLYGCASTVLVEIYSHLYRIFPNKWYHSVGSIGSNGRRRRKTLGIEKFDGIDFGYWKMQIEDYLYGKKLHLPLLGMKSDRMEEEEWSLLDRQVLGVIQLTLTRSVAHNVMKEKTTVDLMKALSSMY